MNNLKIKRFHNFNDRAYIVQYPYALHNIELTNSCPMKCNICPRYRFMKRSIGFMEMKLFRSIIDQFHDDNSSFFNSDWNGTSLHHFGESLLHPQFDYAIAYAEGKGLKTLLSFNPLALTKERSERLFKAKPATLYACVDGFDDSSFEQIRGVKNAYKKSVENFLMALEHKERYSPKTNLCLTMIDIPKYYEKTNEAVKWWKAEHGVDVYRKPFSTWSNRRDPVIASFLDAEKDILSRCCEVWHNIHEYCEIPLHFMSVCYDGTVVPCCRDYNNFVILGNANNTPLIDIWNGAPAIQFRKKVISASPANPLCANCEAYINSAVMPG